MSSTETFLQHNAQHAATYEGCKRPARPAREIAIVGCMDARLDLRACLGFQNGDAHVIRNAGGVVTDDVIRSLTISQRLLGTREIMLVHHTDCGMLGASEDELRARIEKDTGIRPHFAMETFTDLEADVRQSMLRIHASPFIAYKNAVRGFVYDVDTGALREVAPAAP